MGRRRNEKWPRRARASCTRGSAHLQLLVPLVLTECAFRLQSDHIGNLVGLLETSNGRYERFRAELSNTGEECQTPNLEPGSHMGSSRLS